MKADPDISTMPVLALRGLTIFPNMLLHFDVGREASIKALDEAMASGSPVFLVTQKDLAVEEPRQEDLFSVGTISNVKQILRLPGDNVRVMVEGEDRGTLPGGSGRDVAHSRVRTQYPQDRGPDSQHL